MARRAAFQYQDSDPEVVHKHSMGGGDFDTPFKTGIKVYKVRDDLNKIRILPRTWTEKEGPRHWAFPLYLHYDVGPDHGRYACPDRMKWGECPICEERNHEKDPERVKQLRTSTSQLCWIIDRKDPRAGVQLFMMPASKVEVNVCRLSRDSDTGEILKIDHPEEGYDVEFTKKGSKLTTEYGGIAIVRRSTPLSEDDDEAAEWLQFVTDNPIPTVLERKYDYDYIKKVFGGGPLEEDDVEDDTEVDSGPPPRSRRSKPAEEEPETEDDELDSPSSSGSRSSKDQESGRGKSRTTSRGEVDRDEVVPEDVGDDDDPESEDEPEEPKAKSSRDALRERVRNRQRA